MNTTPHCEMHMANTHLSTLRHRVNKHHKRLRHTHGEQTPLDIHMVNKHHQSLRSMHGEQTLLDAEKKTSRTNTTRHTHGEQIPQDTETCIRRINTTRHSDFHVADEPRQAVMLNIVLVMVNEPAPFRRIEAAEFSSGTRLGIGRLQIEISLLPLPPPPTFFFVCVQQASVHPLSLRAVD